VQIQAKLKYTEIPQLKEQMCLKNICIHSHSQLSDVLDIFSRKECIILIARISSTSIKDPETRIDLVNELYKHPIKNNYTVFRQGEERIIVVHRRVKVEDILTENSLLSS
jgi:predicted transcriptional regulator